MSRGWVHRVSEIDELLPDETPGAPPRSNGELVFAAPWESRLFGMTLALHEAGRFEADQITGTVAQFALGPRDRRLADAGRE